jgi:hypothetical protein
MAASAHQIRNAIQDCAPPSLWFVALCTQAISNFGSCALLKANFGSALKFRTRNDDKKT